MMRGIHLFSALVLLGVALPLRAAPPDNRAIEHTVTTLIREFSDGIAVGYPEFRHIIRGRLFGDKGGSKQDAVAFFNIEGFAGSNYHAEYVAVFAAVGQEPVAGRQPRSLRLVAVTQIGGRGWRSFDPKAAVLAPGEFSVPGNRWRETDPGCCPSEPMTVRFRIDNGRVVEMP